MRGGLYGVRPSPLSASTRKTGHPHTTSTIRPKEKRCEAWCATEATGPSFSGSRRAGARARERTRPRKSFRSRAFHPRRRRRVNPSWAVRSPANATSCRRRCCAAHRRSRSHRRRRARWDRRAAARPGLQRPARPAIRRVQPRQAPLIGTQLDAPLPLLKSPNGTASVDRRRVVRVDGHEVHGTGQSCVATEPWILAHLLVHVAVHHREQSVGDPWIDHQVLRWHPAERPSLKGVHVVPPSTLR
jgi:hypothetical protein